MNVLWKSYFGLLKDYFGQRAVEDLSWATRLLADYFGECAVEGLSYSGTTLVSAVEKLSWATQRPLRECAIEELSWATGRTEVRSSKKPNNRQAYG